MSLYLECKSCKGHHFTYDYEGSTPVCTTCGIIDNYIIIKTKTYNNLSLSTYRKADSLVAEELTGGAKPAS